MEEDGSVMEDELFDLNKEPVDRKRKRVVDGLIDNGKASSDDLPKSVGRDLRSRTLAMADGGNKIIDMKVVGRVLRSRTTAMTDGEKQVLDMGIVGIDEEKSEVSASQKRGKKKGRCLRPPKIGGKDGVSSLNSCETCNEVVKKEEINDTLEVTGGEGKKMKRGRGRPPKVETENACMEKKQVNDNSRKNTSSNMRKRENNDGKKSESGSRLNSLKGESGGLGSRILKPGNEDDKCVVENEMGRREQQQLVRDQIIHMLKKAEWTIEYRKRQNRDYMDAVYVDREGKTHWSVTLAYRKFKEKITAGKAHAKDLSAFSLIPEETLSSLFRITEKGKKEGKKKKDDTHKMNRTPDKHLSKKKYSSGRISKPRVGKGRTLLARKPGDGSDADRYELYEGKRSLLSWMIDLGTISIGDTVAYRTGRNHKILLQGRITKDGIRCDCCDKMHTVYDFQSHAGKKLGNIYGNLYVESGNSLLQCLKNSWNKHLNNDNIRFIDVDVNGDDPNDDTCNMCGDGGNLICCDSCPSTFHLSCLCINVPSGDWHCVHCSCKFCGLSRATDLKTCNNDEHSFESELFNCLLCEEKFHAHCTKGNVSENFDYADHPSFCSTECLKIFEHLVILGVRYELEEDFSYRILRRQDASLNEDCSVEEINSKIAVAFTVMDECFKPIIDERSGSNVIHSVVYNCGSNIKRLNFGGFYTIILEKGDELVAAASIRIHGSQLAEMPFIGTRYVYRYQGMCKRLLNAIEKLLWSLDVEKLVIPAISELNETWIQKFGFIPLEESMRQKMKRMSMVVFPGIDMLQKTVTGNQFRESNVVTAAFDSGAGVPEGLAVLETETPNQKSPMPITDLIVQATRDFDTSVTKTDVRSDEAGAAESFVNDLPDGANCAENGLIYVDDSSSLKCNLHNLDDSKAVDSGAGVPKGLAFLETGTPNQKLSVQCTDLIVQATRDFDESCVNDLPDGVNCAENGLIPVDDSSSLECNLHNLDDSKASNSSIKESGSADCKQA